MRVFVRGAAEWAGRFSICPACRLYAIIPAGLPARSISERRRGAGRGEELLYRRFGRTELYLPVITCGGMRYQQSWDSDERISAKSRRHVERVIRKAFSLGIHHFDTARGYGTSEIQTGRALSRFPRTSYILTTKVNPKKSGREFMKQLLSSIDRLGIEHVDVLDIHGINNRETLRWTLKRGGALAQARKAQAEGLVRHVAFSTHGPLDIILKTINTREFAAVGLHYFFFDQRNEAAVERAAELDMGVLIISPTNKGGMLDRAPKRLRSLTRPFSPIVFNDLFCLSNPAVTTITVGAAKPSDFNEHMKLLRHPGDPSEARRRLRPISRRLAEALDVLGKTYCDHCFKCLPCPENVPIPEILRLRNLALAYEMTEFGRFRYNLLEGGGHWFPGNRATACNRCDKCLRRCPEDLDIPKLLAEAHRILSGKKVRRLQRDE